MCSQPERMEEKVCVPQVKMKAMVGYGIARASVGGVVRKQSSYRWDRYDGTGCSRLTRSQSREFW